MNIFKFELKRLVKPCIIWTIICAAIIILFMSMFPSMKDMGLSEAIFSKLNSLPPAMLEAFNLSGGINFSNLGDFMCYTLQYFAMIVAIYGVTLGVNALSKEEFEGTIEFLYSKPVTRNRIITTKLLASVTILNIFIFLVGISTIIINLIVAPDNMEKNIIINDTFMIFGGIILIGYIFMSIGFFISVLFKVRKNNISTAIGVFFITYVLGIIGKLKNDISFLKYFSPIDYFLPFNLLDSGFEAKYIVITIIIIPILIAITYYKYNKKDIYTV